MELITISSFRSLTRLTDTDILYMLEAGELSFARGDDGSCMIDISSLEPEAIAQRKMLSASFVNENSLRLAEEAFSSELLNYLDPIIKEALRIALDWQNRSDSDS
jgi:hypothetical protein